MSTALPTMMPMKFLEQLPKAHDVTDDDECPICLHKYVPTNAPPAGVINRLFSMIGRQDPEPTGEHAVRLPCQHVLGSECIKRWISPAEGHQNTCPYVSASLHSISPPLLLNAIFRLNLSSKIGRLTSNWCSAFNRFSRG